MLILAIERDWESIEKSFKVSVLLKLRRRTHFHNLWLLLVIIRQPSHDTNAVFHFRDQSTNVDCFFSSISFSLPPSADSAYISTSSRRTVNKMSWSNLKETRICYIFRVWVFEKTTGSEFFGSEFSRHPEGLSFRVLSLRDVRCSFAWITNHSIFM